MQGGIMNRPSKATETNLRAAMAENDTVLIRSIIISAGNISLRDAANAFDFAVDGGDPYKVLVPKNSEFIFENDKGKWNKQYFFNHVQKMMRNFSREAFDHYLDVGAEVFPEKLKPLTSLVNPGHTPPPPSRR